MNIAGTERGEFCDLSLVRTRAQSYAGIECPRARVPYLAGCQNSPATVLRASALQSKSARFLAAYGADKLTAQRHVQGKPLRENSPNATEVVLRNPTDDMSGNDFGMF